jgi:hypothetical protein
MAIRPVPELFHVFGSAATATIALVPAVARQRVSVHRMILTLGATAVTITIQDTSPAALSQAIQMAANGAIILDLSWDGEPWFTTAPGLGLQLAQSGTTNIGFDIWYRQGP